MVSEWVPDAVAVKVISPLPPTVEAYELEQPSNHPSVLQISQSRVYSVLGSRFLAVTVNVMSPPRS